MATRTVDKIAVENGKTHGYIIGADFYTLLSIVKSFPGATYSVSSKTWRVAVADIQKKLDGKRKITGLQFVDESGLAAADTAARRADSEKHAAEERAREEQYARSRAQREAQYAAERKAQAQAIAARVQVNVGAYKIGDTLNGKTITGFGKSWTVTEAGTWGQRGIRYDEHCDHCHRIGEVDNETGLCEHCGADGKTIRVCYAYFS